MYPNGNISYYLHKIDIIIYSNVPTENITKKKHADRFRAATIRLLKISFLPKLKMVQVSIYCFCHAQLQITNQCSLQHLCFKCAILWLGYL